MAQKESFFTRDQRYHSLRNTQNTHLLWRQLHLDCRILSCTPYPCALETRLISLKECFVCNNMSDNQTNVETCKQMCVCVCLCAGRRQIKTGDFLTQRNNGRVVQLSHLGPAVTANNRRVNVTYHAQGVRQEVKYTPYLTCFECFTIKGILFIVGVR